MDRYGVYAVVFLYKAHCAGAFQSESQIREAVDLELKFAAAIGDTASSEMHIRRKYSRMLEGLFCRQERRTPRDSAQDTANKPGHESPQPPARDETTYRAADAPFNEGTVVDPSLGSGQDISTSPTEYSLVHQYHHERLHIPPLPLLRPPLCLRPNTTPPRRNSNSSRQHQNNRASCRPRESLPST